MKRLLIISIILLSGCINTRVEKNINFCSLSQEVVDENEIIEKLWNQKITLKGGLSGAVVYKVTDGSGATYVFRNISHRSKEDKIREIHAHKIASKYGYGPQLYAYNIDKGKIVISFLENSNKIIDQQAQIFELANALRIMHNGPAFCDHLSIIDQTKALYDKINYYPEVIDKNKISNLISKISSFKSYSKTPTHRDLNPNNIFFTKTGVKLIDFENAGQDDPFFDIASIIIFYQYDHNAEETFIKLYFGHGLSEEEYEHLALMKKTVSLFYGLTLLSKLPYSQHSFDKPIPSLKEIFNKIASGQFSLEREENIMLLSLAFLLNAIDPNQPAGNK